MVNKGSKSLKKRLVRLVNLKTYLASSPVFVTPYLPATAERLILQGSAPQLSSTLRWNTVSGMGWSSKIAVSRI